MRRSALHETSTGRHSFFTCQLSQTRFFFFCVRVPVSRREYCEWKKKKKKGKVQKKCKLGRKRSWVLTKNERQLRDTRPNPTSLLDVLLWLSKYETTNSSATESMDNPTHFPFPGEGVLQLLVSSELCFVFQTQNIRLVQRPSININSFYKAGFCLLLLSH